MMPKPPAEFCIDSFEYKAYAGVNGWSEPEYAAPLIIEHCRIDRGASYTSSTTGKRLLYNALIFCYEGITTPMPEFKSQSVIVIDGQDHMLTKVIPIYEAYRKNLYSYELEVV